MNTGDKKRKGYVPLYKHIKDSAVWQHSALARDMWIYFLIEAHHSERKEYDGRYTIKRGQLLTSYKQIAQALKVKQGSGFATPKYDAIDKTLRWMKEATMVTTHPVRHGTIITLLNYNIWNETDTEENDSGYDDSYELSNTLNSNEENNVSIPYQYDTDNVTVSPNRIEENSTETEKQMDQVRGLQILDHEQPEDVPPNKVGMGR